MHDTLQLGLWCAISIIVDRSVLIQVIQDLAVHPDGLGAFEFQAAEESMSVGGSTSGAK